MGIGCTPRPLRLAAISPQIPLLLHLGRIVAFLLRVIALFLPPKSNPTRVVRHWGTLLTRRRRPTGGCLARNTPCHDRYTSATNEATCLHLESSDVGLATSDAESRDPRIRRIRCTTPRDTIFASTVSQAARHCKFRISPCSDQVRHADPHVARLATLRGRSRAELRAGGVGGWPVSFHGKDLKSMTGSKYGHCAVLCRLAGELSRPDNSGIYTQFPSQDSGLFGPNPWKVLAPPSNYLSKKVSGQPNPWTNLVRQNLVMGTGCKAFIIRRYADTTYLQKQCI